MKLKRDCPSIFLDVHIAADNPELLIKELLSVKGPDRITLQFESVFEVHLI
jgi:pentose-5-phosphate-3-epimerase